jgi:hypothetical protein
VEIVEMTAVEVGNKQMVSFEEPLMSQVVQQLHLNLGNYIRNEFGLWGNNEELLKACCPDNSLRNADEASMVIIRALWWAFQPIQ